MKKGFILFGIFTFGFLTSSSALAQDKTTDTQPVSPLPLSGNSEIISESPVQPVTFDRNELAESELFPASDTVYSFADGLIPNNFDPFTGGTKFGRTTSPNSWIIEQSANTLNSGYSIRSGDIDHSENSNTGIFVHIAEGGGALQFQYRISSQQNFDFFYLEIAGTVVDSASGNIAWTNSPVYDLPAGEYYIDFWFSKDETEDDPNGIDAVFLDDISITGLDTTPVKITGIHPNAAAPFSQISIYGNGFSPSVVQSVSFGGTYGTVQSVSDNKLVVQVPQANVGFNDVTVGNYYGSDTYSGFSVLNAVDASFGAQNVISTSVNDPYELSYADLDNDGDLDILSASYNDDKIAWYPNNGDGTFASQLIISTLADGALSVFASDLDSDGYLDVISASDLGNKIAWYKNNGDGTFGSETIISSLTDGANSAISYDLDGDGDMDVISASENDNKIAWYANNGDGTFGAQDIISTSVAGAKDLYAGDLNNDGILDLYVASYSTDEIAWFEGNGDGTFNSKVTISSSVDEVTELAHADFNGDGYQDIVAVSFGDHNLSWFPNNGDGTFGARIVLSNNTVSALSVSTGDINGDGHQDIISSSGGTFRLEYHLGNGDGTFDTDNLIFQTANGARSVRSADFDGDGDLDIISGDSNNNIAWYENTGTEIVSYVTKVAPEAAAPGSSIQIYGSGFNGSTEVYIGGVPATVESFQSTKLTVTVPSINPGNYNVLAQTDGDIAEYAGLFTVVSNQVTFFEQTDTLETGLNSFSSLLQTTADFDNDGDLDVLSSHFKSQYELFWYVNDGFGGLTSKQLIANSLANHANSTDFDNDGDEDLVYWTTLGTDSLLYLQNNGDGTYQNAVQIAYAASGTGAAVSGIESADINHDGYPDLIVFFEAINDIAFFLNNGDGTFAAEQFIDQNANDINDVHFADLNGNGYLDMITAQRSPSNVIQWYTNDGIGNFSFAGVLSTGFNYYLVGTSDINGDGNLDIIGGHTTGIGYLINNGNSTFGSHISITSAQSAYTFLAIRDMDGDGDEDFAGYGTDLFWVEKEGTFTFGEPQIIEKENVNVSGFGDFNSDGDTDIITYDATNNYVYQIENVVPNPAITEIIPKAAAPGSEIEIWGKGFSKNLSEVTVSFDGVDATIVESTGSLSYGNRLVVEVPSMSAGPAEISVTSLGNTSTLSGQFTVLKSEGAYFTSQNVIYNAPEQPFISIFADINGDGYQDVVAWSETNDNLDWFENNQAGSFGSRTPIASNVNVEFMEPTDIDNDGDIDLVVLDATNRSIKVYPNLGTGLFSSPYELWNYNTENGISPTFRGFEISDVNGDGLKDFVVGMNYITFSGSTTYYWRVVWHENKGNGTLGDINNIFNYSTFSNPGTQFTNFEVSDYDSDGDQDALIAINGGSQIRLYENEGFGTFSASDYQYIYNPDNIFDFKVADLNKDGFKDLIISRQYVGTSFSNNISVTQSNGSQSPPITVLNESPGSANDIRVLDFNGDGNLDIVASYLGLDQITIYTTDGTSVTDTITVATSSDIDTPRFIDVGDADNDGDLDIVSASSSDDKIAWYENEAPPVELSTIAEARQTANGETVRVQGIITRKHENIFKIQQNNAGLHLYASADFNTPLFNGGIQIGDLVEITGTVSEVNSMKELINISSVNVISSGNSLPAPVDIVLSQVSDFEQYESVLVTVNNLSVTEAGQNFVNETDYDIYENDQLSSIRLTVGPDFTTEIAGQLIPDDFEYTGIIYQSSSGGSDGYALYPINNSDVRYYTPDNEFISLETAKNQIDSSFVRVRGVVTSPNFQASANNTAFYIQDGDFGIVVFNDDLAVSGVTPGDSVEVEGELETFNGLREILVGDINNNISVLNSGNTLPDPKSVSYNDFINAGDPSTDLQNLQGTLVRINDLITDPGTWPANASATNTNVTAETFTGNSVTIRLWAQTEVIGDTPPSYLDLVGVLGSFNGAQIAPRFSNDIIPIETPGPLNMTASAGTSSIDLDWEPSPAPNIGGYNVYRSTSSFIDSTAATRLNTTVIDDTSYTDTTPVENTTYYYRAAAYDSVTGNLSQLSDEVAVPFKIKSLYALSATAGVTGSTLTIYGANLTNSSLEVQIGGQNATIASSDSIKISVTVPALSPSTYAVTININGDVNLRAPDMYTVLEDTPDESGFFQDPSTLATLSGVLEIQTPNLDNDQDLDILTASYNENAFNNVGYLENLGNLTFSGLQEIGETGDARARSVTYADFDGDGILDVVAAYNNLLAWFRNDGSNTFNSVEGSVIETFPVITNYNSQDVIAFDVNLDGDTDIIHVHTVTDDISYYENDGTGSFQLQQVIDGNAPLANDVKAADFDGDGDFDLVASIEASGEIVQYVNNAGTFNTASVITSSVDSPKNVVTADLDNDGFIDVLSVSQNDSKVAWYSNGSGTGVFSAQNIISSDMTDPFNATAADLNGDGLNDVIVSTLNGDLVWYQNLGSGSFDTAVSLLSGAGELRSVAAADLTETGLLDLIAGDYTANQLILLKNVDTPPAPPTGVAVSGNIGSASISWNPNTETDLLGYDVVRSTNPDADGFTSLLGSPQTGTTYEDTGLNNGVTYYYRVVAIDSSNTRVASDTVSIKAVSTQISGIHPATGIEATRVKISGIGFSNVQSENQVQFNGTSATILSADSASIIVEAPSGLSGFVDISVTANSIGYTYPGKYLYLSESEGTFGQFETQTGFSGTGNITSADIDADGFEDLIATRPNDNQISLIFSDGDDPFNRVVNLNFSGSLSPRIIRPINIFGNEYPDFVFTSNLNNEFKVLKNNGGSTSGGNFLDQTTVTVNHAGITDIFPADMNNDGYTDVVISSANDGKISWYENQSFLSEVAFGPENQIVDNSNLMNSIYAADFNGDNLTDIVSAENIGNEVALYQNNGDGSFTRSIIASGINHPERVTAADLNNDGNLDVLFASSDDDKVGAFINNGDGTFGTENVIATGILGALDVSAADLNGDGLVDILATSSNNGEGYWFQNNGSNTFSTANTLTSAFSGAISIHAYDSDGNGNLDVAIRGRDSGTLGVGKNFLITALQIEQFLSNDSIVSLSDGLEFVFDTDLSTLDNFANYMDGTITISNHDGETFSAGAINIEGNSLIADDINFYSLDTLFVDISSQALYDNSGGRYFIDIDGDGIRTSEDDRYFSEDDFYTTMIGDFDNDLDVDFDDLNSFSDGWRNDEFGYETAPLDFGTTLSFPNARLNGDNDFNIDDIVAFIRFWNLTQERSKVAKAQDMAAKIASLESGSSIDEVASGQNILKAGTKDLSNNTDAVQKNSKQKPEISISDSLQFISYSKNEQVHEYVHDQNAAREVTYTFALSHPDSVMALSLIIDYEEDKLSISDIKNHDLFNIHSSNANVFLSHVDSTNGIITLNVANFGTLSSVQDRKIVSLTFNSLDDQDSEIIISSDLRAKGQPALQQIARKAIRVAEELPGSFTLSQNYPNPFNPTTTIHYELAEQAKVNISVFDILGRKVETLISENGVRPGYYKLNWDASRYASGMYIYVLNVKSTSGKAYSMTKKMVLVK
ncbi:FG-GAP-like repeat-containing protein [Gracilimonas sp.]|uniref:FG-GAP-like repeat-containing protein n=1 Tax=Gracilimonas sp. TaxID=1974203 RepID=UPI0032EEC5F5